jgi:acylphosphatase
MKKVSITHLVKPNGEVEVLAASEDAQVAYDAFINCNEEGEVCYSRKISYDKRKVNEPAPKPAKKATKRAK